MAILAVAIMKIVQTVFAILKTGYAVPVVNTRKILQICHFTLLVCHMINAKAELAGMAVIPTAVPLLVNLAIKAMASIIAQQTPMAH